MPILAIIDDLVNDEHMVITWVTAFLLLNIEKINKQAFCQMFISSYWLFSFANQVQEHFYSWMLFMLWAFFGPSSPLRTFKQNDHSDKNKNTSDKNKMTILTKTKWPFRQKMTILTKHSKSYSFHQIHEVLPEQGLKGYFLSSYCILYTVTT